MWEGCAASVARKTMRNERKKRGKGKTNLDLLLALPAAVPHAVLLFLLSLLTEIGVPVLLTTTSRVARVVAVNFLSGRGGVVAARGARVFDDEIVARVQLVMVAYRATLTRCAQRVGCGEQVE